MAIIGNSSSTWRCNGSAPVILQSTALDKRGYAVASWHKISVNAVAVAPAASQPLQAPQESVLDREKDGKTTTPQPATDPRFKTLKGGISCNTKKTGQLVPIRGKYVYATATNIKPDTVDLSLFADDATLHGMLDYVKSEVIKFCESEIKAGREVGPLPDIFVVFIENKTVGSQVANYSISANFTAVQTGKTPWSIERDQLVREVRDLPRKVLDAQLVRQRAEAERQRVEAERVRLLQARQAARAKFTADFSVQHWPRFDEVMANPFRFKNSVVGMYGLFLRMLSEKEAVFDSHIRGSVPAHMGDIFVSDVPSTQFRGSEQAILALKVIGTRQLKTPNGELTVPDLRLVGAYVCRQDGCKDFYD